MHLDRLVRVAFPQTRDLRVRRFHRMTGGWECEIYGVELEFAEAGAPRCEHLVLRLLPDWRSPVEARREYEGMRVLAQAGYPVPRVFGGALRDPLTRRSYLVMERIDGTPLPDLLHGLPVPEPGLLNDFCALFARLHGVEPARFGDQQPERDAGQQYGATALNRIRTTLHRLPAIWLEPVLTWLEQHRGAWESPRPAIVHHDFKPGNILRRPDGSLVVIDWSDVAISDARLDLAMTLLRAERGSGVALRRDLLAGYEAAARERQEGIAYFETVAGVLDLLHVAKALRNRGAPEGDRAPGGTFWCQPEPTQRVVELVTRHTGIRLPDVARLFEQ